jgi:hypothetical protein
LTPDSTRPTVCKKSGARRRSRGCVRGRPRNELQEAGTGRESLL